MPPTPKKRDISIIERRLKSGSIFAAGSNAIPLKDPKHWTARVVNATISDARIWEMQADKGWEYATVDDLAVQPHEVGFREMDGRLVRGTHGHEVLMKMRLKDYEAIQKQKDQTNRQNTFSKKANQNAILNAAASEGGSEAADFLAKQMKDIEITDSLERRSLED